jgi:hypothetical protein
MGAIPIEERKKNIDGVTPVTPSPT